MKKQRSQCLMNYPSPVHPILRGRQSGSSDSPKLEKLLKAVETKFK
ncbi:hypothetical protein Egran_01956 [Elaphomyces granulatus]|uniref:Uncharacterized protein n=1 Tax=Elaphomyces granulatus TaxID=519963 RepID=A0A232M1Q8_9EURO|nr:hypothetical protein Egran_01956 [Elaphomyces granulatus]